MLYVVFILLGLPSLLLAIDFIQFLFTGNRLYGLGIRRTLEIVGILLFPIFYLFIFDERINDCCSESATFSPEHRVTVYILILICIIAYLYSSFRTKPTSPVVEVLLNCILLVGFIYNIFIGIQVGEIYWLIGNIPVGILFAFRMIENNNENIEYFQTNSYQPSNAFEKYAYKILTSKPFIKYPLLIVLCLPILTLIISILLLFGQKPDSVIRAFTDTYKHGFSQLDYLCDNVNCGGHFLCSVAAKGHRNIVKPIRYGERNGNKIICNRQLLIANAFEELIQEKFPKAHKQIRRHYNKVGKTIHRHYYIFNNKTIADLVYYLMKSFEFFFLLALYSYDKNPENRIAKQYLSAGDRRALN